MLLIFFTFTSIVIDHLQQYVSKIAESKLLTYFLTHLLNLFFGCLQNELKKVAKKDNEGLRFKIRFLEVQK